MALAKSIRTWSPHYVTAYFESIGLEKEVAKILLQNEIDGDVLLELTKKDLLQLGITSSLATELYQNIQVLSEISRKEGTVLLKLVDLDKREVFLKSVTKQTLSIPDILSCLKKKKSDKTTLCWFDHEDDRIEIQNLNDLHCAYLLCSRLTQTITIYAQSHKSSPLTSVPDFPPSPAQLTTSSISSSHIVGRCTPKTSRSLKHARSCSPVISRDNITRNASASPSTSTSTIQPSGPRTLTALEFLSLTVAGN